MKPVNPPMSAISIMKYMKTCCPLATVSMILTELVNIGGLTIIEFQWELDGKITARALTEGNLYRNNARLQIVFNEVRSYFKLINQG